MLMAGITVMVTDELAMPGWVLFEYRVQQLEEGFYGVISVDSWYVYIYYIIVVMIVSSALYMPNPYNVSICYINALSKSDRRVSLLFLELRSGMLLSGVSAVDARLLVGDCGRKPLLTW